jgi:L-lactate dehydrogenase
MKVSVIGMGAVGTETVRGLMNMPEIREIVAINRTRAKAEGDIEDLHHVTALCGAYGSTPRVGDYPDLAGSDVVVVTAGTYPRPGGSRDEVLEANCAIVREIIVEVERYSPEAIVLIATVPVEVTTQVALNHTGFRKGHLIGSGTLIDTMRLVRLISDQIEIDPGSVFGYVLGEHGGTGLIPWSVCRICGMDVDTYCRLNKVGQFDKDLLRTRMLEAGHSIFSKKGYTNYGVSAAICRIVRTIALDERAVLPVGTLLEGEYGVDGVVMSVPCVIGRDGVGQVIECDLSDSEIEQFKQSAEHIRQSVIVAESQELQTS